MQDLDDDGERVIRALEVAKSVRDTIDDFDFILTKEHPDEVLNIAFVDFEHGKNKFELENKFTDSHKLKVVTNSIFSGKNIYTLENNFKTCQTLRAGFINLQTGSIHFKTEIEVDDSLWYELWKNWIKAKWKSWKDADIIYYRPENPIDDDDDDIFDEMTMQGNFIKVWMDYHNSDKIRLFVMHHAREDLTADDINALNPDGLFVDRRGHLSNKIIRSVFVKRDMTFFKF